MMLALGISRPQVKVHKVTDKIYTLCKFIAERSALGVSAFELLLTQHPSSLNPQVKNNQPISLLYYNKAATVICFVVQRVQNNKFFPGKIDLHRIYDFLVTSGKQGTEKNIQMTILRKVRL